MLVLFNGSSLFLLVSTHHIIDVVQFVKMRDWGGHRTREEKGRRGLRKVYHARRNC